MQESFLLKVFPRAPCTRSLCKALVQSSHTNLILTQRYHTGEPLVKSLSLCKGSSLCTTSLCMVLVQGLSSREILVQSDPSSCKVLSRGSCTRSSCKADVNARPSCKAPVALVHGPCARLILTQYPCAKWLILVYGPCGKQLILVQGLHLRLLCKDLMKGSPLCKVLVQSPTSRKVLAQSSCARFAYKALPHAMSWPESLVQGPRAKPILTQGSGLKLLCKVLVQSPFSRKVLA